MNDDDAQSFRTLWNQWVAEVAEERRAPIVQRRKHMRWVPTWRQFLFSCLWGTAWQFGIAPGYHFRNPLVMVGLGILIGTAVYCFGLVIYHE